MPLNSTSPTLTAAASAGCAVAPDVGALIAARAVQGAGAALLMPLALALLGAAIPADRRSKALGVFAGVTGLAVPVGPLLGGAIVTGVSWPCYASTQTFNSGFTAAMVACAVLSLAGALSGLVAPGRIPPTRPSESRRTVSVGVGGRPPRNPVSEEDRT
jgi:MFS family permease